MKKNQAHLALLISGLFFGMNYWVAKGLMPVYFAPMQVVFLRSFISVLLFWGLKQLFPFEKVSSRDLFRLALCGLTGISLNQLFFFLGLNFTTPVNAALIHSSSPILVMSFAIILLKEQINWLKATGVILGGVGAYILISSGKHIDFSSKTTLGNLFILINIISYSFYIVIAKPLMDKYHPITVMSWVFLFGFIFIVPFSVSSVPEIHWQTVPFYIWCSLAYVIFITTFVTYLLTIFALKYISATVTGYYIYIQPIIASSIALITGKELLEGYKILAAALIFSGIFVVVKEFKFKRS